MATSTTLSASPEILGILQRSTVDDLGIKLSGDLDRATCVRVNKFLDLSGAKWHKGKKRHLFVSPDAHAKFSALLNTGAIRDDKKHFQSFYTPQPLAQKVILAAEICEGMTALEPNAGGGALAIEAHRAGATVWCYDLDPQAVATLKSLRKEYPRLEVFPSPADFLTLDPENYPQFDRVVMNPPFTRDQDLKHVMHAFRFLSTRGILTAIMSTRYQRGTLAIHADFRELMDWCGSELFDVPAGTFRESGTDVAATVIQLRGDRK